MGTLPDLSAILAAQLGLDSGEGLSTAVPRAGEVPPSSARNAGKGKKRKRGGSGVEGSAEEASDVPPSGEPHKKKKKKKRTKKPVDEQSENPEEPSEIEEGDVQEEELQPEEEASEAEISRERNDAEEVGGGEESETPLNAARPDGSEEDIRESPLLIRRHNDEVGDEARSPILASSREGTPVPIGEGAAQIGTSSRGSAILRRVPGVNFPDKVLFHYEGPAPLVYVPEKCGEFLRQLRGRAKPLPAVKDLIFGSEYEEAASAKLLGDSATNVVIDKYDTALKGALGELELAKKEHAERERKLLLAI
ncbi:PREDICTED: histone H2A.Z-specific chaperone CHZ1-like [Brassica oleracea var. oleracea]|uniref:histone H2A.Z-specific chaperone CHZ1-like n=1 Tax=Brassica oleracea var. oleracea TaxID=109376 RepID=UPI0006A724BE|nr:PREDICTED: histone H2A.Z-specific chaperone CHZ1-like [Brassica oleracea var. oleracea]